LEIAELADEPLLVLRRGFGSREWFEAACSIAHVQQRVLLESAAPHTLLALAATGYGIAIIPSNAQVLPGLRALPLVHRGASVSRWATVAWDPTRFLAPYAASFIDEMVAHCRRDYPGHHLVRRAPSLPRPKSNGS
jgi:DNA-binding transcriptional LysR family regulator